MQKLLKINIVIFVFSGYVVCLFVFRERIQFEVSDAEKILNSISKGQNRHSKAQGPGKITKKFIKSLVPAITTRDFHLWKVSSNLLRKEFRRESTHTLFI